MSKQSALKVPTAQGPYSTTMRAGGFLYLSGQGALDPETGRPGAKGVSQETTLTLMNIKSLLDSQGYNLEDLVQVTCYMKNLKEWPTMNEAYAAVMGETAQPTRTAIGVADLPFGLNVEMTCVAYRTEPTDTDGTDKP